jgi:hypothetical protein
MNAVASKLRIAVFGAGLAWAPHRASLHDLSGPDRPGPRTADTANSSRDSTLDW